MKIIVIHNSYQSSSPSGEDIVFRNEVMLLKNNNMQVVTYEKCNDEILRYGLLRKVKLVFKNMWSKEIYLELKDLIRREKPDICHFHNIWYLISPSAYYACKDAGVPVVQTLHNFRFFCSNGLLLRNGQLCEECIGKFAWRGATRGCYKGSRIYSVPIASTEIVHGFLGTWVNKIDAYISPTEFAKKKFVECGLPEEKIFVTPNFLSKPMKPSFSNDDYAVYLGRLSAEKGLDILLDAFKKIQYLTSDSLKLKIIGEGSLHERVKNQIQEEKIGNVELTGRKSFNDSMDFLKLARFIVIPSICYETFNLAVIEAFACGKPVVASRLGALPELVEESKTGLFFEPGNAEDLASKIKWMLENESACIEMGKNARKAFEEKYTAEKNYEKLMRIYRSVLRSH